MILPSIKSRELMSIQTGSNSDTKHKRRHHSQDIWNQLYSYNPTHNINVYQTPKHKSNQSSRIDKPLYSQLNEEIKLIDQKIRKCKKEIDRQKKQSKVQREKKMIAKIAISNCPFLTTTPNPEIHQPTPFHQSQTFATQIPLQTKQQHKSKKFLARPKGKKFMLEKTVLLQNHYINDLKKKFQRRDKIPHQVCRRKIPKLNITERNKIEKHGYPETEEEHLFRVLTKEITPTQIYPSIPTFESVRDYTSKNVLAYFSDYAPFLQKISKV